MSSSCGIVQKQTKELEFTRLQAKQFVGTPSGANVRQFHMCCTFSANAVLLIPNFEPKVLNPAQMLRYLVLFLYQFAILCHCHELDNTVSNFNVFSASSKSILGLNRTLSLTRPARAISLADVLLISNFREMAIYGLSERALPEYFTYDFPTTVEGSVATTIDEGLAVIGVQGSFSSIGCFASCSSIDTVLIFDFSQGLQKVAFISGAANSSFGHAVAKSGSTLLVSQLCKRSSSPSTFVC